MQSDTEFIGVGTFKVRIPGIPSWSSFTRQFLCGYKRIFAEQNHIVA